MPTPPRSASPVDEIIAKTLARIDEDARFAPQHREALRALAAASRWKRADDIVRALKEEPGDGDAAP